MIASMTEDEKMRAALYLKGVERTIKQYLLNMHTDIEFGRACGVWEHCEAIDKEITSLRHEIFPMLR